MFETLFVFFYNVRFVRFVIRIKAAVSDVNALKEASVSSIQVSVQSPLPQMAFPLLNHSKLV